MFQKYKNRDKEKRGLTELMYELSRGQKQTRSSSGWLVIKSADLHVLGRGFSQIEAKTGRKNKQEKKKMLAGDQRDRQDAFNHLHGKVS